MSLTRKPLLLAACFAVGLLICSSQAAVPCLAQASSEKDDAGILNATGTDSGTAADPGGVESVPPNETQTTASGQAAAAASGDWHANLLIYLWFPGVHGTVGASGYEASVHASPSDLLSNFRFGLMGTADLQYKRVVMPVDMVWVRLGDEDAALPPNELGVSSADFKASEFILTPYVGYRLIDLPMVKFDTSFGLRYWHLGQDVQLSTTSGPVSLSGSQNWADALAAGRLIVALSPKMDITMLADVGGGGAQLDYQAVGYFGYTIKPGWSLLLGWRYMSVNRRSEGVIFDTISSGIAFGLRIGLK